MKADRIVSIGLLSLSPLPGVMGESAECRYPCLLPPVLNRKPMAAGVTPRQASRLNVLHDAQSVTNAALATQCCLLLAPCEAVR